MKKDDFSAKIQEIGTCEDDAQRRTLLAELSNDVGADYDSFAAANQTADRLQKENKELQAANLRLFKMIGNDDGAQGPEPDAPKPREKEALNFKDLFDDKGNLK